MSNKTPTKGYGRIYVKEPEHVDIVENIIKEWDDYEWSYYPTGLVAVFDGNISLVYNGKFDELDLDKLAYECMKKGVFINHFFTGSYYNEEKSYFYAKEVEKGLKGE